MRSFLSCFFRAGLLLVLLGVTPSLQAQTFFPFEPEVAQSVYENPASVPTHPYRWSIGLPGLSMFSADVYHRGFSVNDLLREEGDEVFIDPGQVLPELGRQNLLSTEVAVDLLHVRARLGKKEEGRWVGAYVRERVRTHLLYSDQFLELLWNGNGGFIDAGQPVDLRRSGLSAMHYREFVVSYAQPVRSDLSIGGSVGLVFGKSTAYSSRAESRLVTEADSAFALTLDTEAELRVSPALEDSNFFEAEAYWRGTSNPGAVINLGATYRHTDRWRFQAMVRDLGFIRWNRRPKTYRLGRNRFTGVGLERYLDSIDADNFEGEQVQDTLLEDYDIVEEEGNFTTPLVATAALGAAYTPNDRWRLSAAAQGKFFRGLHPLLSLDARRQFGRSLALHAGLNGRPGDWLQPSLGAVLTAFPVQVFLQTSNLAAPFQPLDAQAFRISGGINVLLGRPPKPDADKDGVPDEDDACPRLRGEERFDGCPDSDNDGIPDPEDECPLNPGPDSLQGCPDSDADGILDRNDQCPQTAGLEAFNGCPDTDGDGIPDARDDCPQTAGVDSLQGCPYTDTDGDGIPDSKDACPEQAGRPSAGGCPDRDGDGVTDTADLCPDTAGTPPDGCPPDTAQAPATDTTTLEKKREEELGQEESDLLADAYNDLQFRTGSAELLPSSEAYLDRLVRLMQENPRYRLLIEGFADSRGEQSFNKELSLNRAETVKSYLLEAGIESWRLIAIGHGSRMPLGDNATEEGRRKNRRVELHLVD